MFQRICRLIQSGLVLAVVLWAAPSWALSKAFLGSTSLDTSSTTVAVTVNSTGYTHIVFYVKHEGAATTISANDNKGSGAYNILTQVNHSSGDLNGVMGWVKIGTPGTSHTVTVTFGATKPYHRMLVWGVNSGTGELALDVESVAQGNGTAVDAGSLATTAATVSFMGTGEYTITTFTPGSGWTEDIDSKTHGQSRSDASGTINPVCTSGAAMDWVASAASYKETGGGGGSTVRTLSLMGVGQ